jgi:hypothetical protein
MSDLTKDQLLNMVMEAQDKLSEAYEIINNTGDYECEDLDKCASLMKDTLDRMNTAYRTVYKAEDLT